MESRPRRSSAPEAVRHPSLTILPDPDGGPQAIHLNAQTVTADVPVAHHLHERCKVGCAGRERLAPEDWGPVLQECGKSHVIFEDR